MLVGHWTLNKRVKQPLLSWQSVAMSYGSELHVIVFERVSPIAGFCWLDADSFQRLCVEHMPSSSFVADKQGDLIVWIPLHRTFPHLTPEKLNRQ